MKCSAVKREFKLVPGHILSVEDPEKVCCGRDVLSGRTFDINNRNYGFCWQHDPDNWSIHYSRGWDMPKTAVHNEGDTNVSTDIATGEVTEIHQGALFDGRKKARQERAKEIREIIETNPSRLLAAYLGGQPLLNAALNETEVTPIRGHEPKEDKPVSTNMYKFQAFKVFRHTPGEQPMAHRVWTKLTTFRVPYVEARDLNHMRKRCMDTLNANPDLLYVIVVLGHGRFMVHPDGLTTDITGQAQFHPIAVPFSDRVR